MDETRLIHLDSITVDNGLNPRVGALDQEAVLDYAAHIDDLPPMVVFKIPGEDGYLLAAGFHRIAAHRLAGATHGRVIVREGSRADAAEYADLDNLRHGLQLSRAERREVIRRQLKRHPDWSDVRLASACFTTDKTVRSVREALEQTSEIPRLDVLVGADGIERPRTVSRPTPPPEPPPAPLPEPVEVVADEAGEPEAGVCARCIGSKVCQTCKGTGMDPRDKHSYCPECGPNGADGRCPACVDDAAGPEQDLDGDDIYEAVGVELRAAGLEDPIPDDQAGPDPDGELEIQAEAAREVDPMSAAEDKPTQELLAQMKAHQPPPPAEKPAPIKLEMTAAPDSDTVVTITIKAGGACMITITGGGRPLQLLAASRGTLLDKLAEALKDQEPQPAEWLEAS